MSDDLEPIAIVGTAGRFPGAATVAELWRNVQAGVSSISRFGPEELIAAGVEPLLAEDPGYLGVSGYLPDADRFDAEYFGFSRREAELLDPQHRLFLECVGEALDDAGCDPARFTGAIGLYAGTFMNKYLPYNLLRNERFRLSPAAYFARNSNDKDFLVGRAAYAFDLHGPVMTVQTACSTSLVAVHLACQALLSYECDAALAGGVALNVPLKSGYPVLDGGLLSPTGECRPFDARAAGTVPGYGAAVVMLRRLSDAVADGDDIRAVIRGTAVNNDGAAKMSFTAPSVPAQVEVIAAAQAVAGVTPDTIGYVETHGTGTPLGDPIEVAALTEVFRAGTDRTGYCALGAIKANIGHLDAAAGVTGLIRATLAIRDGVIPPQVNFEQPNPQLKLEDSPFYVPTVGRAWGPGIRRAGVSSFGVGGTNAHVVLEQAPAVARVRSTVPWQLLPLSGRNRAAVDVAVDRLAGHLREHTDADLADVAYTLQSGRREFEARRFAVVPAAVVPADGAAEALTAGRSNTRLCPADPPRIVFTFPGGGSQHPDMALEVYEHQPVFAAAVDRCTELLRPLLGFDLRCFLYPSKFGGEVDREHLPTVLAGIFTTSYALAQLWQAWGIEPVAMLGHSLGEYVAACLAGVFSLADALHLTVRRGELFSRMPSGRMLSIALPVDAVEPLLGDQLSIAAVNAPELTLVSGPTSAIEELAARLEAQQVEHRLVRINVASHSAVVEPYLPEFEAVVASYQLSAPQRPLLSGVTGTWLTGEQACDPAYWARHLRQPVRFADCVREATALPGTLLLEVGPGQTLTGLAASQRLVPPPLAVASLPHARESIERPELAHLLESVGRLWQAGVVFDWRAVHGADSPVRTALPAYPFQRRRYWVSPDGVAEPEPDEEYLPEATDDFEPPQGPHELAVAELWTELLGTPRLSRYDDFAALGGHSLMAAQLARQLKASTGVNVTVRDVFARPTIAELAELLAAGSTADAVPVVDLAAEAVLDPAIRPGDSDRTGPARVVLLTGATGFLGAFLCAELLRQTSAEVRCLVRASSPQAGLERVRSKLESFGLLDPSALSRLTVVIGDLAEPRLGVEDFERLADEVDAIYHCGAWVNFVRPYQSLKAANVLGTQEILRLAATGPVSVVHHVSTLAVLAGAMATADELVEDAELPPPVGHDTAYSQSKWVAEQLVHQAAARGLPVSVYRPGVILGDSRSGVANADDYLTAVIAGCIRLGKAPLRQYPQSVGTVDDVARTIVALAVTGSSGIYHTIDPEPLPWNHLFDQVRAAGHPVESIPFDEWRAVLAERLEAGDDNVLAPLADLLDAATGDRRMPHIQTTRTSTALAGSITHPPLDAGYFDSLLRYFTRSGWLPPATSKETA